MTLQGKRHFADEEELLDAIDEWHDGAGVGMDLHEYLGWTWAEFTTWVETSVEPAR